VPARETESQVKPLVAHFQAFFATIPARLYIFDQFNVATLGRHRQALPRQKVYPIFLMLEK
jgi:hypothetical protein